MQLNRVLGALALAVALVAAPSALEAQNASTTGQIRGRITSDTGQPLAGVALSARNVETGLSRTAVSTGSGLYVVRLLPPGLYTIQAEVIGYRTSRLDGIRVGVGGGALANFQLSTQAIEVQGIEVVADRPQIDVQQGGVVQFVSQEQIEELPSLGRDFTDFINLSGLVAPDPGETTGGQFAIAGQRASQTSVQIDGVDANNSFFGENRGGSRIPFVFSLESIREFEIITNGFDVEHGRFSGGIVNVVTKGGTNDFKGTLYGNFRDDALTASPFVDAGSSPEITTDYKVQQFSGLISGPIVRDKAHFLLSIDGQRRREPQLPLTRSRFAPGAEREDAVLFEEMGRYLTILGSQYGVNDAEAGYQPFETTNDAVTVFGRIDWTVNETHRLSVRHNYSTFSNDNEWNGVFDFDYGLSRAEKIRDWSHSFVTELQSVFSDNTFNVFRFQLASEKRPRQGKDLRPTLTVNLAGGQRARFGGSFASYNNNLEETKYEVINNFTHVAGDHTWKLGGTLLYTQYLNRFQNFGSQFQGAGEYVFNSLDDFAAFRPATYFRPVQQGGGIPTSNFDVAQWAVYLQDEWQVSPKLMLMLGLRYDQQSFLDSPTPVVDVERAFGFRTGFAPTDTDNLSPRVSFAYDVNGDGSKVIRGGGGIFYGVVPGVLGGNVLQTERPTLEVFCTGSIAEAELDAPPSPSSYGSLSLDGLENPADCGGNTGASGVPTYTFWKEDFQYPETFKANLGYETFIGDGSQLSVDLLYSRTQNLYTVRNLNLRDTQFTLNGEDGRRVFTPAANFNPTGANSLGARRNLEFSDVFVNFNDGRAQSFIVNVEGAHRVNDRLTLRGSYTYTRAFENSNYSCCTAAGGYDDPTTGVFGPNLIGDFGDTGGSWGRSDFGRDHAIILSGFTDLPLGFKLGAIWTSRSGRPYTVVVDDDINGDGFTGNDRAFIFSPENLPLASTGEAADEERATYRQLLADNSCVGDYVGEIVERNTCRYPWANQLDLRITKVFDSFNGQRAELQVDFFNALHGIGRLFCDEGAEDVDLSSGACGWGRITGVFGSDRELIDPRGFDPTTEQVQYRVNPNFGTEDVLGDNLVLQFQIQIGLRYFF